MVLQLLFVIQSKHARLAVQSHSSPVTLPFVKRSSSPHHDHHTFVESIYPMTTAASADALYDDASGPVHIVTLLHQLSAGGAQVKT
ncbi:hypothetical protein ACI65C_004227 [Semiaphis heraclei]